MAGVQAGRLSLEILADIARLQSDLDKAKRAVNAASKDIATSAKYANDNLAGMGMGASRAGEQLAYLNGTTKQTKAGFQQLGFQIGDFSTQVSSGTSVAQAFAQQIGQTSQAIALMGGGAGALGRLGAFLGGPWGVALTVGLTALAPLVGKLFESEDAAKKAKDAHLDLSSAIDRQKASQDELRKAIDDYNNAQAKANDNTRLYTIEAKAAAEADLRRALAKRELLAAELAGGVRGQFKGIGDVLDFGRVIAEYDQNAEKLKENQKDIARLQQEVNNRALQLGEYAAKALDPLEAIRQKYADINREIAKGSVGGKYRGVPVGDVQVAVARRQRAEEEAQRQAKDTATKAAVLTAAEVARMVKEQFGGSITSTTGGKHADKSFHYPNQAVDFVPQGGMGAITKADIREWAQTKGIRLLELLGPGDKDHADHFHIAFAKTQQSQLQVADRALRDEERRVAEAERARVEAIRRQQEFDSQSAALDSQILGAQRRSITDAEDIASFAKQQIQVEADKYIQGLAAKVALGDLAAADRDILAAKRRTLAAIDTQAIDAEEARRKAREAFEIQSSANDNQLTILQLQEGLATTSNERRDLALRILEIEKGEERRALERQALDETLNAAIRQQARDKLAQINEVYDLKQQGAMNATAGPLESYMSGLPDTAAEVNEALQSVAVNGLQSLENGILSVIDGTKSLGDAFKDMASQIIADLLRIQIQKMIVGLASSIFGGVGAGVGGANSLGGGLAFGAASGGYATGTNSARPGLHWVGEEGPELMGFRGGEQVIPNHRAVRYASPGNNDNGKGVVVNLTMQASGDPRADRESAMQASNVLRRRLNTMSRIRG